MEATMLQTIVRDNESSFAELARKPGDLKQVFLGIQSTILNSFKQDGDRGTLVVLTDAEFRNRFKICEKWFRVMRGDCGYSVERAVDFLPRALRCELDGVDFEPPKADGAGWSPDVLVKDHLSQG
jgi:hypothetical protein